MKKFEDISVSTQTFIVRSNINHMYLDKLFDYIYKLSNDIYASSTIIRWDEKEYKKY